MVLAVAVAFMLCVVSGLSSAGTYKYVVRFSPQPAKYGWGEVVPTVVNATAHALLQQQYLAHISGVPCSRLVLPPVLVSLVSISARAGRAHKSILTVLQGSVLPTHIYLFVSFDHYLLDDGVRVLSEELLVLVASQLLTIVYTANIGPHRKLLPLLEHVRGHNPIIVTLDDDLPLTRGSPILYLLLKGHALSEGGAVVALRARRVGLCQSDPQRVKPYLRWSISNSHLRAEMLVLPTGAGGVLYKPAFFHSAVFDDQLRLLTGSADDLMFRLCTMAMAVKVFIGCPALLTAKQATSPCDVSTPWDREYQAQLRSYRTERGASHSSNHFDGIKPRLVSGSDRLYAVDPALGTAAVNITLARIFQHEFRNLRLVPLTGTAPTRDLPRAPTAVAAIAASTFAVEQTMNVHRGAKSLFSLNRHGLNDLSWRMAIDRLGDLGALQWASILLKFHGEREAECYAAPRNSSSIRCALWPCM